jgi:predicted GNAT superfamily acetyltransferase
MEIRRLDSKDVAAAWQINEQGLPGTGKVSHDEMADLLSLSELPIGVFDGDEMLGFVLCLTPRTRYASLNYAWFNQRYQEFLYVDRIAVAVEHRDRGIGSLLYGRVIEHGESLQFPVTAEVNLTPPNPGSIRFHERHSFTEVGVFSQGVKSVTMVLRSLEKAL